MAHSNFVVARKIQLLIYLIHFNPSLLRNVCIQIWKIVYQNKMMVVFYVIFRVLIHSTNFDDSDRLLEVPLKPRTFILLILDKIIENITLIHANLLTKHLFLPFLFSRALVSSLPLSEHSYSVQQWAMRLRILDK